MLFWLSISRIKEGVTEMTHEELLKEIDELNNSCSVVNTLAIALRAVVELHKPFNIGTAKEQCSRCTDVEVSDKGKPFFVMSKYPCTSIQIIEKELHG